MTPEMATFLIGISAVVSAIIALKVFFTCWKLLEKRLFPEQFAKPNNSSQTAFRGLKGRHVILQLKNGEIIQDYQYITTIFFGDGEFNICPTVYFAFEKTDRQRIYICGADILKIETQNKT